MDEEVNVSLEALRESAHTYRSDLVRIPVLALESSTRFMTVRPGVRYKETLFSPDFSAELQPYANAERNKIKGEFKPRTLETNFGASFFDFDPNQMIASIIGHRAAQAGEGTKSVPSAREVAASVVKNIGKRLNTCLFSAKQDEDGKSTDALFDGFDTITEKEIEAGNISEEKGNLVKLTSKITFENAGQLLKEAMYKMTDELREEDCFMFCSRDVVDAYNENYLLTHQGIVYNDKFNQPYLEGSDGMITFAPCAGKRGSKYIHICPKSNMLVGVDQVSDKERVEFHKYEPKTTTGELYMFFGTQFESIDPRRMLVIELVTD